MNATSPMWFLRKESGAVYGPVAEETLQQWARDGRVAPEDYVSADQVNWVPPFEIASLEMVWFVELPDGLEYGPAHRAAIEELVAEGSLASPVRLRHATSGERIVLGDSGVEAAPPSAAEPVHKGDTQRISDLVTAESPPTDAVAPAPQPAAATEGAGEPERTVGWRALALERDRWEQEALKWKGLYERTLARLEEQTARVEELSRAAEQDRLAFDAEREELRRRVEELAAELDRAARAGRPDAQIVEAYHELVRNYDVLAAQLNAKGEGERRLHEELAALRAEHEAALATAAERSRRERELAEQVQRRLSELERAHLELVRSYRELNDRYIRLRDSVPPTPESAHATGAAPEATTPAAEPPAGGTGRLRLWR
ncbi:MAG: hypothetical protein N2652_04755 [Kiritimatiellae bacterium]|nr:hypothetical protein [Kiritimatiellia bacterium]